jgi:hypothetical protein
LTPRPKPKWGPLPWAAEFLLPTACLALLFSVAAPIIVHAQQTNLISAEAAANIPASAASLPAHNNQSTSAEQPEDPSGVVVLAPTWITSSDSSGNIRQHIKVESDYAVGDRVRLGLLYGQSFICDGQASGGNESIRDAGFIGRWRPNERLKLDGMFGVSELGSTTNGDGQAVSQTFIPITNIDGSYTSAEENARIDLGFKRSIFDLSPELVANRVVRNDFVIHPQIGLQSGWRFRELAEIGPVTSAEGNNYRYNSEFTVARKLAKNSELYSTFTTLHYAHASDAGYFSPTMVHNLEGGWSTEVDRKSLVLSLDCGLGAGHAKEHGETFGSWGLSAHTQTDLTWKIRQGRNVHATYEFYYDQSAPPLESAQAGPWHMSILTVSFRWLWD